MFKLAIFCVLALAAAQLPTISLELDQSVESYKLAKSIYRPHDLGYKQPSGKKVTSRQVA